MNEKKILIHSIKLTITDNIEPIEILFWKLFRNKAIYKKIFSFMYNQYSFSYDSVSSITKLIDSNQISILREKAYRNCRYLEFGETCWRKESDQSSWRKDLILIYLKKLFEIIKNDFKFYRNFFKIQRYYYSSPIYTGSNKIIKYILELKKSNSPSSTSFETSLNNTDFGEKSIGLDEIPKNDNIFKGLLSESEKEKEKEQVSTSIILLKVSLESVPTTIQELKILNNVNLNFIKEIHFIEIAFRFGNCEILSKVTDVNNIYGLFNSKTLLLPNNNKDISSLGNYNILFSHCCNDNKEKKMKFMDQLSIESVYQTTLSYYMFIMLIVHNDIELLRYYCRNRGMNFNFYIDFQSLDVQPTYYIESTEMLDYLFNNHIRYFLDPFYTGNYSTHFKSLILLKHFESLLFKTGQLQLEENDNLVCFIKKEDKRYNNIQNKNSRNIKILLINHFSSNPSIYYNERLDHQLFLVLTSSNDDSSSSSSSPPINFEVLKDLAIDALKFDINLFHSRTLTKNHYTKNYLKFIEWMFLNYNDEMKKGGHFYHNEVYYFHLLMSIDQFDYNNNSNDLKEKGVKELTPYLFEANNFKFLNWFLTNIKDYHHQLKLSSSSLKTKPDKESTTVGDIVCSILSFISSNSRLKILEYIQNFSFILKNKPNNGVLNPDLDDLDQQQHQVI
ncbi:hypothetical protein ACTFIT_002086 [Dictyostelium discoideum]